MNFWRSERRFVLRGAVAGLWLAVSPGLSPSAYSQSSDAQPAVNVSRNGICHEHGTVHFQQTIYYEAFESMKACLTAGGSQMGSQNANDRPQFDYRGTHPPRNYWPYLIVGISVAGAGFVGVVLPLWRRWKARQSKRSFADREKRHWEEHKLESRKPPKQ